MEVTKNKRSNRLYRKLERSPLVNHYRTDRYKFEKEKPGHSIWDFLTGALLKWLWHYLKNRFGPKYRYPKYESESGIYKLTSNGEDIVIGIAADWATNTEESIRVAQEISKKNPHYSIHLGDTYYVGEPDEIAANFLPEENSNWHRGSKGSFAVLGNHEMYARGIAFFRDLLPNMGLRNSTGKFEGQKAGYFCLENEHWRILGLDTGYHSVGKLPILEMIPKIGPNCHFDQSLMDWLSKTVKLSDPADKRGIVILTHHQPITAFKGESEYVVPAKQIGSLLGSERPIIWLFGHEHKLALYEKSTIKNSLTAYCRCMGNGGMPIEINKQFQVSSRKSGSDKLVMVDRRIQPALGLGYNGYVLLKLLNSRLTIEYYDINTFLLSETWMHDINSGAIKGTILPPVNADLKNEADKVWTDIVKP